MPKNIFLQINSSGCLTSCEHCWAQSKPFENMPIADVEAVLFKVKEYLADKPEYKLWPFPMFEELAHPETVAQMNLFRRFGQEPEPLPTSGIALAVRPDWRDVLECVKELEFPFMVLSFHGIGATHDKAVNRKDAFEELKLALERVRSAGIDLQFNVFITKENIGEISELINNVIVPDHVHERILISVARYNATSRGRRYEKIRAEYSDAEKISSIMAEYSCDYDSIPDKEKLLADIKANTEAELVKLAVSLSEEERSKYKPRYSDHIWLTVDRNLDLFTGHGNFLTTLHGNIKKDNFSYIMNKALSGHSFGKLHSCFSRDISDADIAELAVKYGDPAGSKIYEGGLDEIKAYWIDQAFAEWRRY